VTTARGLLVFSLQSLLFAVTLILLMQESTKLILHPVSAYIADINNLRRAAASVLYIGSGMLAFYRETSLERAMNTANPIPMLVDISDTAITGIYAEVLDGTLLEMKFCAVWCVVVAVSMEFVTRFQKCFMHA
jgi:hypothetical protein